MVDTDHTGEGVGDETSTPTTSKGWVSIQQLAILMERDYRTVRKWVEEGRVRAIRVGGRYRIFEEEIHYILKYGTREPTKTNGKNEG